MDEKATTTLNIETVVNDILQTIDREREREIIARRYGLFDRKETLEQIGELLSITRERVRQLEKSVVTKLKQAAVKELPHIGQIEQAILAQLEKSGNVAKISDLTQALTGGVAKLDQARIAFLADISPNLSVIEDNDSYHHSVGNKKIHDEKSIKDHVAKIIDAVKSIGEPTDVANIRSKTGHESDAHVSALASISKQLAQLNNRWGLTRWPLVNPKNIRDKIYVVLKENGKPMHFNDISKEIKQSSFRRKDVTTQAIHNELIKDKRFVLIGRGIYALNEWGYQKGTVSDIIAEVLKKEGGPLHRDEIVKRVLSSRQVKETTILLNLQGKDQFKRVAKATYALAE
jgi:DNA-binding CsgD family transcriptional regulator